MMPVLERATIAFLLRSDLSLAQMKPLLEASQAVEWNFGDSEWYGDYVGGIVIPEAVARVYSRQNGFFHIELRFVAEAGDISAGRKFAEAQRVLRDEILPAIHACDVRPTEPMG